MDQINMRRYSAYWARVRHYRSVDSPEINYSELFLMADSYANAAAQIERVFKEILISFELYNCGTEFLYVDDIEYHLQMARDKEND